MPFPFLSLPPEVRHCFYSFLQPPQDLSSEWTMDSIKIRTNLPKRESVPEAIGSHKLQLVGGTLTQRSILRSLLFVNRQINEELTHYFYRNTTLMFYFNFSLEYDDIPNSLYHQFASGVPGHIRNLENLEDPERSEALESYSELVYERRLTKERADGAIKDGLLGWSHISGGRREQSYHCPRDLQQDRISAPCWSPYERYTRHAVFIFTRTYAWHRNHTYPRSQRRPSPLTLPFFQNLKVLEIRLDVRDPHKPPSFALREAGRFPLPWRVSLLATCPEHIDVRFRARFRATPFTIDWYSVERFYDRRIDFLVDSYLTAVEGNEGERVIDNKAKLIEDELKKWQARKEEMADDKALEAYLKTDEGFLDYFGPPAQHNDDVESEDEWTTDDEFELDQALLEYGWDLDEDDTEEDDIEDDTDEDDNLEDLVLESPSSHTTPAPVIHDEIEPKLDTETEGTVTDGLGIHPHTQPSIPNTLDVVEFNAGDEPDVVTP